MAKKKTAPVLRVENPGSRDEQSTPVITKSYSVRDDWKDKDIVNYVAFKSVDGEVQDLTVNGEPAGGGGMFSTATLTSTVSCAVQVPYIVEGDGYYHIGSDAVLEPGNSLTIVLVNGSCLMHTEVTVTGSAEVLDPDENIYKVTGNVTLS